MDGHRLILTNLEKVLYPDAGFTKAQVISYYARIAPVLLPHLRDRPVTLRRYPDGVAGESFFEKNVPRGAPRWVRTVTLPRRSRGARHAGDAIVAPVVGDTATLVWVANLAAIEIHVPMWRGTARPGYGPVDLMVFDLDPGEGAAIVECAVVAGWIRDALRAAGLQPLPKTSGAKGLQLYVPLRPPQPWAAVRDRAHELARAIEAEHGDLVVSNMRRDLRAGKVLIDWSQNHPAKTTVAPYSLRARPRPTVSTPVAWDEVEALVASGEPADLTFEAEDVLERVRRHGDLLTPLLA